VTDEPAELVEPWMLKNKVTHPVVILPNKELEGVIGVKGFPTSAVFHGNKLKWTGHPSSSSGPLGDVQKDAKKTCVYPKKLSKVIKLINKGDMVKAMVDLHKLMEKLEGEDAAWAGRLEVSLNGQCSGAFADSAKAIEDGFWYEGILKAQPYLGKGSPYPGVEETVAKLELLKEEDLYAKEISGGKSFKEAQATELIMEYTDAVKKYKSVMKKCRDTQIAGHARAAAEKLIQDRRPGYKPSCPSCSRNKGAACSKHHEEIKL